MGRLTIDPVGAYPNLFQVLGGYLHQDFDLDFDSPEEALQAAATGQGSEQVGAAIRELDELLSSHADDDVLIQIVERLTTGYSPVLDGWQIRPWLEHTRAILEEGVAA
jgi:hypothetical protein